MGFAGNLHTLALPEVLQTLTRIKATGVLRLASAEGGRDVVFDQGELVGVAFRRGEERQALLRRLILDGRLDATTAAQISQTGRETQVIGRLIDAGMIDAAAVKEATQRQAEEELQSLFTWDYADFVFHDATPEDEETTALVLKAREDGIVFNVNSLLMESARRQDEWERVRQIFPDGGLVLGTREGQEEALAEEVKAYPASAVLPLVDAVRSLDDIVKDSVATRLDAWSCLSQLMDKSLLVALTRDDIIYHGDYLVSKNDLTRACSLYRRALAARPSDSETASKLADCLAKLGDSPEAAASFAQLAIGALNAKDMDLAVGHARKAVRLQPKDPLLRHTLVRCLLAQDESGNRKEAIAELISLVETYASLDRLEDARSSCLKVLELDKGNEGARRHLARIFSTAANDEQSEDVIVCVQCGHINHREAQDCEKCKASLLLTCLACGRPVGVSDRICIFCGADPHKGEVNRRAGGNPATSRIANPANLKPGAVPGGPQEGADRLSGLVASAKAKEEGEDWEGALDTWRQVASIQTDNADLIAHIKDIETLVHDSFLEKKIEEGHQLRRVRRYWAAIACYKAALRTMSSDDARVERLKEILASTTRVGQRIALLYSAAGLVILLGGVLAIQPWMKQRRIDAEITSMDQRLQPLVAAPDGAQLAALKGEIDALLSRVEGLGDGKRWIAARTRSQELSGNWTVAWQRAAARALEQVFSSIEQGDLKRSRELLAAYTATYRERSPRVIQVTARLDAAQKRRDELNARIQDAPNLLAGAEAEEGGKRFGPALAQYRTLAESPNAEVAAKAKAAVGRLAPRADAASALVQKALDAARSLQASDLAKAEDTLVAVTDEATVWGLGERVREARSHIAIALTAAKADAIKLGPEATREQLAEFLVKHSAAPEALQVRQRHDAMVRATAARTQALERFQGLIEEQKWEAAWTAGRDLVSGYGPQVGELRLPLWIESRPLGATVKLDGKPVGSTPCVLRYQPGQKGELIIEAAACQPLTRRLEQAALAWRLDAQLIRAQIWKADLGKPVVAIGILPGGEIAVSTGDGLARLTSKGQVRWRIALGGDDLGSRARAETPTVLPEGRLALPLTSGGIALIDARGGVQKLPSTSEVRGRPISYVNEVLGAIPRVAFAAEAIFSGSAGGDFKPIPLTSPAISGPVAVTKDIDKMLVIANTRGRLVGIEESTRKTLWELDVQAADVGQLVPVSENDVVALLDGARLACFSIGPRGAMLRWTHQLEAPAVGDPVFADGVLHVATGAQIVRIGVEGTVQPALPLPAVASCAVAVHGDRVIAGAGDGTVHVFKAGEAVWSTPLPAVPTAVGLSAEAAYVAWANGSVASYSP